jgi:hypothetical protein
MTKKELKNAIEYIEMFIEDFKYDCQHQKETHSAISSDDEEFKETLKILENIRNELKAQKTPKKYLTWEDVIREHTYKVLLNGKEYEITKFYDDYEYRMDYISITGLSQTFIYEVDKQFFNDLHLELVGE